MGAGQSDLYKGTYGDNIDNIPEQATSSGVKEDVFEYGQDDLSGLTDFQKSAVKSIDNTIRDHLKESDFSGVVQDLKGDPIPKVGDIYYNHINEMRDSYNALTNSINKIERSLQNPYLGEHERSILTNALERANNMVDRIMQTIDIERLMRR